MAKLTSLSTEDLIPKEHPIREIRRIVDEVLGDSTRCTRRWAAAASAVHGSPTGSNNGRMLVGGVIL